MDNSTGCNSQYVQEFNPYFKIPGPAIMKIQCISSAADTDVTATYDGYLLTN